MGAIVTLTSDFGLGDSYVAAMKGVILSINPGARLVDICHDIEPQNIRQAAFILSAACHFFPKGTIHLVVVDPGVGTDRRAIVLRTPMAEFVAPDNGVLSYVIQQSSAKPLAYKAESREAELEPELEAVAITNPEFWRSPVSPTFHGRDIFAPVAAWLSRGFPPASFGEAVTLLKVLPLSRPHRASGGLVVGHVIHIDNFGNLITDIRGDDLPAETEGISVRVGGYKITGLRRAYGEGEGLLALIGSNGYLEVAVRQGNAADWLSAKVGDEVRVKTGGR